MSSLLPFCFESIMFVSFGTKSLELLFFFLQFRLWKWEPHFFAQRSPLERVAGCRLNQATAFPKVEKETITAKSTEREWPGSQTANFCSLNCPQHLLYPYLWPHAHFCLMTQIAIPCNDLNFLLPQVWWLLF